MEQKYVVIYQIGNATLVEIHTEISLVNFLKIMSPVEHKIYKVTKEVEL